MSATVGIKSWVVKLTLLGEAEPTAVETKHGTSLPKKDDKIVVMVGERAVPAIVTNFHSPSPGLSGLHTVYAREVES